jgi:glutathione S-transferase
MATAKPILITVAVGNNPARVRLLVYLKGLDAMIDMRTPADYGGLASDEYRALNPQGKLPVLILPDGSTIFEARVVSAYIADRYAEIGPALNPPTPELRAKSMLINQIHDLYLASPNSSHPSVTATQGCMYKAVELIAAPERQLKVAEIAKQLDVLEGLVVGPLCVGTEVDLADLALYPTFLFFEYMLPRVFGWSEGAVLAEARRPKLKRWFETMDAMPAAQRVRAEIIAALSDWESNGKFEPIKAQVAAHPELQWADF